MTAADDLIIEWAKHNWPELQHATKISVYDDQVSDGSGCPTCDYGAETAYKISIRAQFDNYKGRSLWESYTVPYGFSEFLAILLDFKPDK